MVRTIVGGRTVYEHTAMSSADTFLTMAFVIGYLLGSIPFRPDPDPPCGDAGSALDRSGNIGATNVLRTGHKGLAAATLILDMLKGTAAVLIAGFYDGPNAAMLAAFGASSAISSRSGSNSGAAKASLT